MTTGRAGARRRATGHTAATRQRPERPRLQGPAPAGDPRAVASRPIGSQREVVDALSAQGFDGDPGDRLARHLRARAGQGARRRRPRLRHARIGRRVGRRHRAAASDERLVRILGDIPVTIGRSGLILVLTGTPGTASVIAQAIDESSLREQEGTLAGDNTLLVLFADESRLERWPSAIRDRSRHAPEVQGSREEGRPRLFGWSRHVGRRRLARASSSTSRS